MTGLLLNLGWNQFDLAYSPELAPSDFHLFLHLKSFSSPKFNNDDELKENDTLRLTTDTAMFDEEGIQQIMPRDRCQNIGVSRVEKIKFKGFF